MEVPELPMYSGPAGALRPCRPTPCTVTRPWCGPSCEVKLALTGYQSRDGWSQNPKHDRGQDQAAEDQPWFNRGAIKRRGSGGGHESQHLQHAWRYLGKYAQHKVQCHETKDHHD